MSFSLGVTNCCIVSWLPPFRSHADGGRFLGKAHLFCRSPAQSVLWLVNKFHLAWSFVHVTSIWIFPLWTLYICVSSLSYHTWLDNTRVAIISVFLLIGPARRIPLFFVTAAHSHAILLRRTSVITEALSSLAVPISSLMRRTSSERRLVGANVYHFWQPTRATVPSIQKKIPYIIALQCPQFGSIDESRIKGIPNSCPCWDNHQRSSFQKRV